MKTHMIHCDSEFRAYALIRQIKSAWWVLRKHETQIHRSTQMSIYLFIFIY